MNGWATLFIFIACVGEKAPVAAFLVFFAWLVVPH